MNKLLLHTLFPILLFSFASCENDDKSKNPFVGTWYVYFDQVPKLETSFNENYSWSSKSIPELYSNTQIQTGIYYFNDSILTIVNANPENSIDTSFSYYSFTNSNEFELEYIGPIKIGVPKKKYIRKQD